MNNIIMLMHFHKEFPFNFNSSWVRAGYAGGTGAYEYYPPTNEGVWINTSREVNKIQEYRHYYSHVEENVFLKAMGQQSSEYWLWKYAKEDFIGCSTYRRYLVLKNIHHPVTGEILRELQNVEPTVDNCIKFSSNEYRDYALELFEKHDVITNIPNRLTQTVEQQYLESQPVQYWDLFIKGIEELMPDYRNKMGWFHMHEANFTTTYIFKKHLFKKYVSEHFEILEYVWLHSDNVFPIKGVDTATSEPFPWRFPGFLGERFLPFFIHANDLKPAYVPLATLN